ncbi:hypothetical protein VTK73DRAFT_1448 [Phialemonium thermophilum]|uniref:Uncharacterized protein n=1 Tax=Phialemonium thermophilum TaxID=223376 RepID=A0ABR3VTG0_9PEZI
MTDLRRGQPPLSIRLPLSSSDGLNPLPDLPPASALFLIEFDVRAGYTIVWKRAAPGVELEGVVEYRSLPSGLHTVDDDLIYFVHEGGYAGLSAFVNAKTDDEESRNARMIAVGILVPLSYGRLGRAWRHCQGLRDIAKELSTDVGRTDLLESYWESHGARDADSTPSGDRAVRSPSLSFKPDPPTLGKRRARNLSTSEATPLAAPENVLSPYHPAWSLTSLLDTFGPLIFPIHRAALLRKRILISTHAPVHECITYPSCRIFRSLS